MARERLDSGWIAARANQVQRTGEELTTTHAPSLKIDPWMDAVVPGTVLATLLKNAAIPDPFYGMENQNVPDIADAGRDFYTFWFCNKFATPERAFKRAWLHFRAINYSAEVYVNGSKYSLPGGMFFRHKLDIKDALKKTGINNLAVLVHPPDHPGRIPAVGGQGGDHDIAKDVAAQYVQGWDWIIPIRDRNTGIWDEVSVSFTGVAILGDPHLVATFHDDYKRVYLVVSSEVTNTTSTAIKCTAKLQVSADADDGFFSVEGVQSQPLEIVSGATTLCSFEPLYFYKPRLWWPNGMGEQALYQVEISLEVNENGESDSWSHNFGFRKIDSFLDPVTKSRHFQVNGQPVFIRGGNWIVSDGLLRLSKERYETDVNFHADTNMNMIRVWGGALAERPEFYDACDKRGILVWQEFWITGDCNGRGVPPSDASWPLDHALFLKCARDTVKLLRNHASLALWVGGNEQHPPEDINQALMKDLKLTQAGSYENPSHLLDGTRLYIQGSLWEGFAAGTGEFRDGPYNILNPEDYFQDGFYAYGFNPEVGSVGVPLAATIKATMPESAWDIPTTQKVSDGLVREIPNATWTLHTYIPYANPDKKVPHQIAKYGDATDLDDFCDKAQLVNYVQYRALMESWNSRMWTKYTGVLIWKTQNPWPGLRGQLYDYFLDQTGGFYGVKSACEPVHVQYNPVTYAIEIVNTTRKSFQDTRVEAAVWDLKGNSPYQETMANFKVPAYKTIVIMKLTPASSWSEVYFLLLTLVDSSGTSISRNFYWLHQSGGDYKALKNELAPVPVKMSLKSSSRNGNFNINVEIENLSSSNSSSSSSSSSSSISQRFSELLFSKSPAVAARGVAFWLRLSVHSRNKRSQLRSTDTRLLPVSYSQNYFSIVPGEKLAASISFQSSTNDAPEILLQGWNIGKASIALPHNKRGHRVSMYL
ncbi:hypothetical protein SELMODRAFT_164536 [Selaginella moellendorffii]|uniref:Uncharacterized protein n=1 Tax=Selaginella moellendorffii TaxID=88036 RepID=D8QP49_SELML|nr:mannosylglycoprotein endo-beta-mannosidase [Selaginella moellendorffii]EFJ38871.1 hypothetical protein SELMODRAFT_164536 [Selaginella moellendorffii]|eukprot:XP_002961332.1 mannosylglycoprotein endo-beta-mannosidase [Selaginella moellendorffii]